MCDGTGDRLAGLLEELDPDRVSGRAARELWAGFDRIERLAAAGKTLLARRVAATHQQRNGTRSAAEELARSSGGSAGQAKDSIDTSQRLPEQPPVQAAVRRGQLSAAQANLISGAAAADPTQAHRLVEAAATLSLAELREECLRVKAGADPDPQATHRRIHHQRYLRRYTDSEGAWNLHARGTAEHGALVNTVLDPIIDHLFGAARRAGRREPYEAYAFDALLTMADRASQPAPSEPAADGAPVDGGPAEPAATRPAGQPTTDPAEPAEPDRAGPPDTPADTATASPGLITSPDRGQPADPATPDAGTDAGTGRTGPQTPKPRPAGNPRYLALLRIDIEALRRGHTTGQELCEITGVGPIPVPVARGLLGQAIVKLVITRGVEVANITHLGRGPTAAQRAAPAVDQPQLHSAGLPLHPNRNRPPRTLGAHPAHPPGRTRPAMRMPPRSENPARLRPNPRHRQTTIRPTRPPPTPPGTAGTSRSGRPTATLARPRSAATRARRRSAATRRPPTRHRSRRNGDPAQPRRNNPPCSPPKTPAHPSHGATGSQPRYGSPPPA